MDLTLATREVDGRAVVAVGGEIDVYTAPKLRDQITDLVGHGSYHIVIDLEAVEFLDSTGLGVLVGGLKKVRAHDGSLELICSRAHASANSASASLARPCATTRSASARMTAALSGPRGSSSETSSGVMMRDMVTSMVGSSQSERVRGSTAMGAGGRSSRVGACVPGRLAAAAP